MALVPSMYNETRTISGILAMPVFQRHAAMSCEFNSAGRAHKGTSFVAMIAALGVGVENLCAPWGMNSSRPLVDVAGSCKKATRQQRDHSTSLCAKSAEATFDLARLICLNSTYLGSCCVGLFVLADVVASRVRRPGRRPCTFTFNLACPATAIINNDQTQLGLHAGK